MKFNFKSILLLIVIIGLMLLSVTMFSSQKKQTEQFVYSDLIEHFNNDMVQSFTIDGNLVINLVLIDHEVDDAKKPLLDENGRWIPVVKDGKVVTKKQSYELASNKQFEQILDIVEQSGSELNNLVEYDVIRPAATPWWQTYLPFIILGILLIAMFVFVVKSAGAVGGGKMNSFSKSRAKVAVNDKDSVKFADVAGADEEKAELEEVVEFLKDPAKFVKLGARIPRGVLLVGPPGTGKTLLARAVAGEAGVPFFSISGSDFVEMYVGVGASRVRDLFESARRTPASIIFIDEIDAVGRHRGAGLGGGHDEREQTLNQLLVEMDGFGTSSGVIVMAATNRPDILDPALLRPGRFDRRITVNYPDLKGREAILKVHCRNKPLEETVDLRKIAETTIGFTGAELANLMNEAALRAAKNNKALIGMEDIEQSYMKLLLGPQKKTKVRTEKDNKLCAYHEAGHAVASYYCENTDPIKHITIIPAGSAGGVTLSVPTEDRMTTSKKEMLDRIVLDLGGRAAEEIILDDISTGASSDIQNATNIARNMVTRYGMSDKLGTVLYGSEHSADEVFLGRDFSSGKNYSEKTAAEIDDEIRCIISNAYKRCLDILNEHIDKLHFVAQFLLKNEVMDEEQFAVAMATDTPTIEQIENIAEERKRKSDEENKTAHENNAREEELRLERERLMREALELNKTEGVDLSDAFLDSKDDAESKEEDNSSTIAESKADKDSTSDIIDSDSDSSEKQ